MQASSEEARQAKQSWKDLSGDMSPSQSPAQPSLRASDSPNMSERVQSHTRADRDGGRGERDGGRGEREVGRGERDGGRGERDGGSFRMDVSPGPGWQSGDSEAETAQPLLAESRSSASPSPGAAKWDNSVGVTSRGSPSPGGQEAVHEDKPKAASTPVFERLAGGGGLALGEESGRRWLGGKRAANGVAGGAAARQKALLDEQWLQWWKRAWPVVAILNWWTWNVLTILGNKWIFQVYQFNFPLVLTTTHFLISSMGAVIAVKCCPLRPLVEVRPLDILVRMAPMSLATCLNIVLGNVSLRFIPVTFMQTIKAFTPATTVLLQRVVWGKHFDRRLYWALLPISGGIALTSCTELSFHLVGFLCVFVSCFVTSISTILAEVLLHGKYDLDSLSAVYYMVPQATLMLAPFALAVEGGPVVAWFRANPSAPAVAVALCVSGAAAFFLNFGLFWAIQATSAITFNVAGNLKVAVAIILGWLIFQNPMSPWSALGCFVTVAGCTLYGVIQQAVKVEAARMRQARSVLALDVDDKELQSALIVDTSRMTAPMTESGPRALGEVNTHVNRKDVLRRLDVLAQEDSYHPHEDGFGSPRMPHRGPTRAPSFGVRLSRESSGERDMDVAGSFPARTTRGGS